MTDWKDCCNETDDIDLAYKKLRRINILPFILLSMFVLNVNALS